ncbi:Diguanylate cyclase [Alteripontixanthobacter maritimus]|uniref:Diguanylate cyclase n=1 Tax=Alteripontixanthobacter maritimus TaxID=2161824 RepID=A0A369Q7R7_9SPHN|nr:EAL domain-containing protein [Alteripontixanthobacter maritimus]RDC60502.1 Diguanylate cyclase [Alteripontixanthobacter maritimus]
MTKTTVFRRAIGAAAGIVLTLCAVPALADNRQGDRSSSSAQANSAFDAKIGEAQASMMADPSAALKLARDAAKAAQGSKRDMAEQILTSQWLEGEALMRLNRADEAQEIIAKALAKIEHLAPSSKLHADLLRSQASLKAGKGEYGEALAFFQDAHDSYKALGEARSQAIVLQNIGSLYSDARDYERVLDYYRQANVTYKEDNALSVSAHNNRGNALKALDRFGKAEQEFRLALASARKMSSPMLEARIFTNIASAQLKNGQVGAAEQSLAQGIRLASRGAADWLPFLYGVKAQIAFGRGNTEEAWRFISRTFASQDVKTTAPLFRDFHETAYQISLKREDYQSAVEHLAAFNRLDSQASSLSAQANNALLGARFDATNRELRISRLSAAKVANEVRLTKAEQQVWRLTGGITLALIAILTALFTLRALSRSRATIKNNNDKLTYLTQHDGLTGLLSRGYFRNLFDAEFDACMDANDQGVLMLIDLDRFKQINDVHGHAAGDYVLVEVATRFREVAGDNAVIGRLGGDEFGLFLPHSTSIEDARNIAANLTRRLGEVYYMSGTEMTIGASIGLTVFGDQNSSTSVLMTNADLALYEAKDRGRGIYVEYSPKMRIELEERVSLERDLEAALANDEISISYQPIVGGGDRKIKSYEALMRWNHPTRGNVPPSVFIPVAEDALLIERLGAWMLRKACAEAKTWDDAIKLSVNISALQLSTGEFLTTVIEALASSGLAPNRLLLELTESIVLEMDDETERLVNNLADIGVSFVLDDFGHGYSSLNYIEKMNFSMIKIDRDSVQTATAGSSKSQAIVTAIVSLARSLDIDVTAEGIEADDQLETMTRLGCSSFQGYLFGAPKQSEAQSATSSDSQEAA